MAELASQVVAVTVYPDRARISRRGKVSLEAGEHRLEADGLPLGLNPDSLRVAARGSARARLLGAQLQRTFYEETPAERVRALEEQIEASQDELQDLELKVELVKQSRANLNDIAGQANVFAAALTTGEASLQEQMSYFSGLRLRAEELIDEQQNYLRKRRELERRLQKLKNELDQQRSTRPRERYTAIVEVEVLQAGDLSVELSYVVSGAGWKPLYDIRLVEGEAKPSLEVGYLAQVTQTTGEAWQDVALSLSTARPALAGRLPELDPWYINALPAAPSARALKMRAPVVPVAAAQEALAAAQVTQGAPLPAFDAEEVLASVETSGAALTYQVPGAVTVPPDGTSHKVVVARFSLEPALDYVSAPKLVEAAYRRAKVANQSLYTLLPGQASLFVGDEFVGTAALELIAPQGEIELYLGVDDRIAIQRELKRREVDKRLIGGKRRTLFGYEIELENLLPGTAKLLLHDQLPVARHEEIKVRLESADPRPTEHDELNLLDWELELAPKEKRVVRFDFSVEHPQEMSVVGLP
jgi:uncharacterized protein (TIGR02231 family)